MPRLTSIPGPRPGDYVAVANDLFHKFRIPPVRKLSECEPSAFITLYEGVLGDRLTGIIHNPVTREDEIHNVQCVVDHLASDILHCDLSHITGEAVADGDETTIQYLLEILEGLVDYVLEQIGDSETSSEIDDFKPLTEVTRSPSGTEEELGRRRGQSHKHSFLSTTRSIDNVSLPSSISGQAADAHSELSDSTAELIKLGEETASYWEGRAKPTKYKDAVQKKASPGPGQFDLSEGPLSQIQATFDLSEGPLDETPTLQDGSKYPFKMSSSFSTVSWPQAPPTASFSSPASKPATSTTVTKPARTSAYTKERISPHSSLLGSLLGETSRLSQSREYGLSNEDDNRGLRVAPESYVPYRRSPRFTSQQAATKTAQDREHVGLTPQLAKRLPDEAEYHRFGSSTTQQKSAPRRRSPRLSTSEDPTGRHQGTVSYAGVNSSFSTASRGIPSTSRVTNISGSYPAMLPRQHDSTVQGGPAFSSERRLPTSGTGIMDEEHYSAVLPSHRPTNIGEQLRDGLPARDIIDLGTRQTVGRLDEDRYYDTLASHEPLGTGQQMSKGSPIRDRYNGDTMGRLDGDRYYDKLPSREPLGKGQHLSKGSPTRDHYDDLRRYPAKLPMHDSSPPRSEHVGSRSSPGISTRLRGSQTKTSEREKDERVSSAGAGKMSDVSSLIRDMEDSYDRSFMQRKVARRRRVAFEDEQPETRRRDHDESEQPAQRFRPGTSRERDGDEDRESRDYQRYLPADDDEEEDGDDGHHHEDDSGRDFAGEDGIHPYQLRSGKKASQKKTAGKSNVAKVRPQRGVLLPRSIPQRRQPPADRFEDAMNKDAKGMLGRVRRSLAREAGQQAKLKTVLHHSYASNLHDVKRGVTKQTQRRKRVAKQMDSEYKAIHGKPKAASSQYDPARKYKVPVSQTSPKQTGKRRTSRSTIRSPPSKRQRAKSSSPGPSSPGPSSPIPGGERPLRIGDDDLLPTLMHEFPFLHVSPHTAQRMWAQQMKHMEHLTKAALNHKYKKPKSQAKIEEAERKQEILVNIMKKELAHNQRLREIKERRNQERVMQTKTREQRQTNARARRYYDEFHTRAKSRAMKRRTREEQIFKHLFEEGMAIQKARIQELRKYSAEKREDYTKRQQDELESLENYYRDQFSLLAENIEQERKELNIVDKAQSNAVDRLKKDMRRRMEREIKEYQEQLYRDEDAEYFRQLEADRMKHELQIAKYKAQQL